MEEIETPKARLAAMQAAGTLTPELAVSELTETVMPLMADLAGLSFDNTFFVLRNQVEPLLDTEAMARVNVLLQMFRGSLQVGIEMAPDEEAKQQATKMMDQVDIAIMQTAAAMQGLVPQPPPVPAQPAASPPEQPPPDGNGAHVPTTAPEDDAPEETNPPTTPADESPTT